MKEEKDDSVDEDLEERRRRWEGIHGDEAAQSRLPFEGTILKGGDGEDMSPVEWLFGSLGCLGGTAVLITIVYGLYQLIVGLF